MLRLGRPPKSDVELWWVIKSLWGITLPNVRVCPEHVSPFEAVAHAYFAREPGYAVWYASRGSGKSLALAVLGLTKTFILDVDTTILGGSMTQSQNVREHMSKLLEFKRAPVYAMRKNTATAITTTTGKLLRPLPASQTTVRGPHPPLSLLDEIDEMEWAIYEAALGQAMEQLNSRGEVIGEYIVASSTWQNPEGCQVEGTLVTTREYGDIPIEQVPVGAHALTSAGWREVTHRAACGRRATVTVRTASGRSITCTSDHEIRTDQGWVEAGLLSPGSLIRTLVGVDMVPMSGSVMGRANVHALPATPLSARQLTNGLGLCEVMAVDADSLPLMVETSTSVVDSRRDELEMPRVNTRPNSTEMVEGLSFGERTDELLPHPTMGEKNALRMFPVGLVSVPGFGVNVERPEDTVVGVEGQDVVLESDRFAANVDRVVEVVHSSMLLPMWDLTVDGAHEYVANGILVHNTMTKVIDDARDKGLPVFTWCYRELLKTPENPNGWMSKAFIDRKRRNVSHQMWITEYELNEPSGTDRAVDLDKVEEFFTTYPEPLKHIAHGENNEEWTWEEWEPSGDYYVGADWAKSIDKTVIAVIRADGPVRRLVYLRRVNKHPYPVMIAWFDEVCARYNAQGMHDVTGLGSVVHDFSEAASGDGSQVKGFDFRAAKKRTEMLLDYIVDFENGAYLLPRAIPSQEPGTNKGLTPFYRAHRNVTNADVYAPSKWDAHLPDDFAAMALAHRAAGRTTIVAAQGVPQSNEPRKVDAPFHTVPDEGQHYEVMGGVTIVDERYDEGGTFWLSPED